MIKIFLAMIVTSGLVFAAFTRDGGTETVTDDVYNLMWQDDTNAAADPTDWQSAVERCEALDFAGHQDWRLPNAFELQSTLNRRTAADAKIQSEFVNVSATNSVHYWSSTTHANDTAYTKAWYVNYYTAVMNRQTKSTNTAYVRCVRTLP